MISTIIETSGYIIKEVNLKSLNEHIVPKTCVLMALGKYPGYYGEEFKAHFPESFFIILQEHYSKETIARSTKEIKKYLSYAFEAYPGEISLYNNQCRFIRIKGLTDFAAVQELQNAYIDTGLKLKKKNIEIEDKAVVKVEKEFLLEEFEHGCYRDQQVKEKCYFEVPDKVNWKMFQKITSVVKNNWDGPAFDAAMGALYRYDGLQDVVRIYAEEMSEQEVKALQERFSLEMKLK